MLSASVLRCAARLQARPASLQCRLASSGTLQRSCAGAVLLAPTEQHLQHVAALLAQTRSEGDCYCLYGSVGAGKSVFSRAFIRAAADDPHLPVPSPTYLLQLIYSDHEGPAIHHFDLYRLDAAHMGRLDLGASFSSAVSLVEWAERLPEQLLPEQRLDVQIDIVEAPLQQPPQSVEQPQGQPQQHQQGQRQQVAHGQQRQQQQQQVLVPLPEPCSDGWLAAAGEDEQSDEDDPFSDRRWRRVRLTAVGDAWSARLAQLMAQLHAAAAQQQQQQQRQQQGQQQQQQQQQESAAA